MVHDSERTNLLRHPQHSETGNEISEKDCKVYLTRWWILTLFSALSILQCAAWFTFSSVATSSIQFYHTTSFYLNLLTAGGCVIFVLCVPFTSWYLDKRGLRETMVVSAIVVCIGTCIRCFARTPGTFWIVFVGQSLVSIIGPVVMQATPKISSVWFKTDERTTATAIGGMANAFGIAIGFLLALMVKKPSDVMYLVYIQSVFSVIVTIAILLHFPAKPPTPPTPSSELMDRIDSAGDRSTYKDLILCMKNRTFIMLVIVGGWSQGVSSGWLTVLDLCLKPFGYSQSQIGWLGFVTTTSGVLGGVIVARFADHCVRRIKWLIIGLFLISAVCFTWYTLLVIGKIPSNYWLVLFSAAIACLFLNGAQPLFYELSVELTYPVSETTSCAVLTSAMNLATFTFIFLDDVINPTMMNWLTVGSVGGSAILLIFSNVRYKRNEIDTQEQGAIQ